MTVTVTEIPVASIVVDPINPRQHVDQEDVDRLASSIATRGVDQPIHVRPIDDVIYGALSGQQRLAAACQLDLDTVPCIVHEGLDDQQARLLALTENVGSAPMCPTDEARAIEALVTGGMTQRQVALACGMSQPRVSNLLKLLELPEDLRADVDAGKVGVATALNRYRRRYANGHGKPRGTAAARAREHGPVSAAHLNKSTTARLLGVGKGTVGKLVDAGELEVDPVSNGIPLHSVVDALARQRQAIEEAAGRAVHAVGSSAAVDVLLPAPVAARLRRLAEGTGRPPEALVLASVERLLREAHV